jgi:hypothetical protein
VQVADGVVKCKLSQSGPSVSRSDVQAVEAEVKAQVKGRPQTRVQVQARLPVRNDNRFVLRCCGFVGLWMLVAFSLRVKGSGGRPYGRGEEQGAGTIGVQVGRLDPAGVGVCMLLVRVGVVYSRRFSSSVCCGVQAGRCLDGGRLRSVGGCWLCASCVVRVSALHRPAVASGILEQPSREAVRQSSRQSDRSRDSVEVARTCRRMKTPRAAGALAMYGVDGRVSCRAMACWSRIWSFGCWIAKYWRRLVRFFLVVCSQCIAFLARMSLRSRVSCGRVQPAK